MTGYWPLIGQLINIVAFSNLLAFLKSNFINKNNSSKLLLIIFNGNFIQSILKSMNKCLNIAIKSALKYKIRNLSIFLKLNLKNRSYIDFCLSTQNVCNIHDTDWLFNSIFSFVKRTSRLSKKMKRYLTTLWAIQFLISIYFD